MFSSHSHRTSVHAQPHRYSQSGRPTSYAAPPQQQNAYPAHQLHHSASTHSAHRQHSQSAAMPDQNQLWGWFCQVDKDGSGSISVTELQTALVNGDFSRFDLDTVKMLMNMFDTDRSGTITFNEFQGLWKYIVDWQTAFRYFDRDRSGTIDGRELADALRNFGYNLSPTILMLVEQKYASVPYSGYGPPPGISFDRFVRACVVVRTLTEAFKTADTDRDGWIQINYEDFMKMILSAP